MRYGDAILRAAMTISASWFVSEMRGKLPAGFELEAMNLPVFADGISNPATLQTQSAYYFLFASGDPAQERATVDSPVALRAVEPGDYSPLLHDTAELVARAPAAFDAALPGSASQLAVINQALTTLAIG